MAKRQERVCIATGNAYERGVAIGMQLKDSIIKQWERNRELYAEKLDLWESITCATKPLIEKHAPFTFQELQGMASVEGLSEDIVFQLACEYEMYMTRDVSIGKCSGFCITEPFLCGQTNDEDPDHFFNGKLDVLIHHKDPNSSFQSILYTHPGYPCYFGMNTNGLFVLWQYIDNGERALDAGVPTCVILRELLFKDSVAEALEYLKSIPRTVPNNYILCRKEEGFSNVECSPNRFTVLDVRQGDVCHTNHILFDQAMQDNDISLKASKTTVQRLKQLRDGIRENRADMSLNKGKMLLSQSYICYEKTLVTILFEPSPHRVHARFKDSQEFITLQFDDVLEPNSSCRGS
mmetsp:Transcript_8760/g.10474  ORF Transcript_8760/g.10474 Transcript_8760/m.10474 type:complete len:349 (+) Transcript_8760:28-1074(+)